MDSGSIPDSSTKLIKTQLMKQQRIPRKLKKKLKKQMMKEKNIECSKDIKIHAYQKDSNGKTKYLRYTLLNQSVAN